MSRRKAGKVNKDAPSQHPVGGKFGTQKDPLEIEESINTMRAAPMPKDEKKRLLQMTNQMIKSGNLTQGEKKALEVYKVSLITSGMSSAVHEEFQRDFWRWLLGRGTDIDTKKTPWGCRSLAYDPEVSAYIDQWVVKKEDYKMKLKLLETRVPIGINQCYLYFKYIVRGAPVDSTNFLGDWDIMVGEFQEGRDRGDEHRWPAHLPHETAPYSKNRRAIADEFYKKQGNPTPSTLGGNNAEGWKYDSDKYNKGGGYDSDDEDWKGPQPPSDKKPKPKSKPEESLPDDDSDDDDDGDSPEMKMAAAANRIAEAVERLEAATAKADDGPIPMTIDPDEELAHKTEIEELRRIYDEHEASRRRDYDDRQAFMVSLQTQMTEMINISKHQNQLSTASVQDIVDKLGVSIKQNDARVAQIAMNAGAKAGDSSEQIRELQEISQSLKGLNGHLKNIYVGTPSPAVANQAYETSMAEMRADSTKILQEQAGDFAKSRVLLEEHYKKLSVAQAEALDNHFNDLIQKMPTGVDIDPTKIAHAVAVEAVGQMRSEEIDSLRRNTESVVESSKEAVTSQADIQAAIHLAQEPLLASAKALNRRLAKSEEQAKRAEANSQEMIRNVQLLSADLQKKETELKAAKVQLELFEAQKKKKEGGTKEKKQDNRIHVALKAQVDKKEQEAEQTRRAHRESEVQNVRRAGQDVKRINKESERNVVEVNRKAKELRDARKEAILQLRQQAAAKWDEEIAPPAPRREWDTPPSGADLIEKQEAARMATGEAIMTDIEQNEGMEAKDEIDAQQKAEYEEAEAIEQARQARMQYEDRNALQAEIEEDHLEEMKQFEALHQMHLANQADDAAMRQHTSDVRDAYLQAMKQAEEDQAKADEEAMKVWIERAYEAVETGGDAAAIPPPRRGDRVRRSTYSSLAGMTSAESRKNKSVPLVGIKSGPARGGGVGGGTNRGTVSSYSSATDTGKGKEEEEEEDVQAPISTKRPLSPVTKEKSQMVEEEDESTEEGVEDPRKEENIKSLKDAEIKLRIGEGSVNFDIITKKAQEYGMEPYQTGDDRVEYIGKLIQYLENGEDTLKRLRTNLI